MFSRKTIRSGKSGCAGSNALGGYKANTAVSCRKVELVDHFFPKGEYTPGDLKAKMKELISDSPIRPHIGKADKAPLWIPRKDADYIVVTCPECLRSSSIPDQTDAGDLQLTECFACGAMISYLVDSSVLKALHDARPKAPAAN